MKASSSGSTKALPSRALIIRAPVPAINSRPAGSPANPRSSRPRHDFGIPRHRPDRLPVETRDRVQAVVLAYESGFIIPDQGTVIANALKDFLAERSIVPAHLTCHAEPG
jgi:hypothetical protein